MYKLAVVTSHPVQYQAPFLQAAAADSRIDLTVFYGTDDGINGAFDKEFGRRLTWDRALLDGYNHQILTPRGCCPSRLGRLTKQLRLLWRVDWRAFTAVFVHSYATPLSLIGILMAKLHRVPVLLRTESQLIRRRPWILRLLKQITLRPLFATVDAFLCIGKANRTFYGAFGVEAARLFSTPYCVDSVYFQAQEAQLRDTKDMIRAGLNLPAGPPVILYSGKLIALKRVEDLIVAHADLLSRGITAHVLIVGEGPQRQHLEMMITANQRNYVTFAGFQNQTQLPRYYAAADMLVLPSSTETWGLVVNEGMIFGLPVVATTSVGCGSDLIEPGITGLTYRAGDISGLTTALAELIGNPQRRALMGAAAQKRVGAYSPQACVAGLIGALRYVAESRLGPGRREFS